MNSTQRNRINDLLNAQITYRTLRKRIKMVRDPVELHQLAYLACDTGVWHDEGFEWPQSIAIHPYCDAGTALMLYWMESPEFLYENMGGDDSTASSIARLKYIKSIEQNYLSGMYRTSKIKVDPKVTLTSRKNVAKFRWLPVGMLSPSPGRAVATLKWKRDDDYNLVLK